MNILWTPPPLFSKMTSLCIGLHAYVTLWTLYWPLKLSHLNLTENLWDCLVLQLKLTNHHHRNLVALHDLLMNKYRELDVSYLWNLVHESIRLSREEALHSIWDISKRWLIFCPVCIVYLKLLPSYVKRWKQLKENNINCNLWK